MIFSCRLVHDAFSFMYANVPFYSSINLDLNFEFSKIQIQIHLDVKWNICIHKADGTYNKQNMYKFSRKQVTNAGLCLFLVMTQECVVIKNAFRFH